MYGVAKDDRSNLAATLEAMRARAANGGPVPPWGDIAYSARQFGASKRLDASALSKVFNGSRPYDMDLLAGLARALGYEPEELPHYRLAKARELLDEREVGLDAALEALERSGLAPVTSQAEAVDFGEPVRTPEALRPSPQGPRRAGGTRNGADSAG